MKYPIGWEEKGGYRPFTLICNEESKFCFGKETAPHRWGVPGGKGGILDVYFRRLAAPVCLSMPAAHRPACCIAGGSEPRAHIGFLGDCLASQLYAT